MFGMEVDVADGDRAEEKIINVVCFIYWRLQGVINCFFFCIHLCETITTFTSDTLNNLFGV